jgi:hypothetical protein
VNQVDLGGATGNNDQFTLTATDTKGHLTAVVNGVSLGTFRATQSVQVNGAGGNESLTVKGSSGNDAIAVDASDVLINGVRVNGSGIANWSVNGQGGNDSITLNTGATATVNGGTGTDTLIGPNQTNAWNLTGAASGTLNGIGFTNFRILIGSTGDDTFAMGSAASGFTTVRGGAGNNSILGPDVTTLWSLSGSNAGKVGAVAFSNIGNLQGGTAQDTFKFGAGSSLKGWITGGEGDNVLDYTTFKAPVTVDLSNGDATATGGVAGIRVVLGAKTGGNVLVGGQGGSILVGFLGNNFLTGGFGGKNILIGGSKANALTAGDSGDIVIGGSTAYDTNIAALLAILAEWNNDSETYQQRVDHIRGTTTGGINGTYYFKASTVMHDTSASSLIGGGIGMNWYFANISLDSVLNRQSGEIVS